MCSFPSGFTQTATPSPAKIHLEEAVLAPTQRSNGPRVKSYFPPCVNWTVMVFNSRAGFGWIKCTWTWPAPARTAYRVMHSSVFTVNYELMHLQAFSWLLEGWTFWVTVKYWPCSSLLPHPQWVMFSLRHYCSKVHLQIFYLVTNKRLIWKLCQSHCNIRRTPSLITAQMIPPESTAAVRLQG